MSPSTEFERALHVAGYSCIAGIDEAGRGCWAGPVVAAAVVLTPAVVAAPSLLAGVDDSKQLSRIARETQAAQISASAGASAVGVVPAFMIDAYGILPATRLAMLIALLSLPCAPDALLIDAVTLPGVRVTQQALIRGDSRSLSIAAASILAKVHRDRLMRQADQLYPGYGFGRHKGYGTDAHQRALTALGPCPIHRRTFQPLLRYTRVRIENQAPENRETEASGYTRVSTCGVLILASAIGRTLCLSILH
ncbi:ribonuclease HII [Candidatus Gracilibacteria bacterium]|nr:ribonuclease HII [Candidatus Gracilibacteria bacterium]